jgi:hypothetical protein
MNLGGGSATVEKHSPAGTVLALRFTVGLRTVRAQVLVRESPANTVNFEIVEITLADRARLRQLLSEADTPPAQGTAKNRVRRRLPPKPKR